MTIQELLALPEIPEPFAVQLGCGHDIEGVMFAKEMNEGQRVALKRRVSEQVCGTCIKRAIRKRGFDMRDWFIQRDLRGGGAAYRRHLQHDTNRFP